MILKHLLVIQASSLQVERIQNKMLYQYFDELRRRITRRWATILPDLQVMSRLWHGTRTTDPYLIYAHLDGASTATKLLLAFALLLFLLTSASKMWSLAWLS